MKITAKVIKDSVSNNGTRITTMELEYPRFIHSEFMTHRMFSRNAASSRAIPVTKVIEQVESNIALPIHWGKNQAGMQAKEELHGIEREAMVQSWIASAKEAVSRAKVMSQAGLHKQVVNRILEPYQIMKVLVTATEWENFFWLRDHTDAQPEIRELAIVMKQAMNESCPQFLETGMWHLPYVNTKTVVKCEQDTGDVIPVQLFYDERGEEVDLEQAIKISCSSCAQVSYRKLDTSLEKAEEIYKKLVESEPVHASAFEHVAKAMRANVFDYDEPGVTHVDREGFYWSGNFRGWIQYRQLIPNNVKKY